MENKDTNEEVLEVMDYDEMFTTFDEKDILEAQNDKNQKKALKKLVGLELLKLRQFKNAHIERLENEGKSLTLDDLQKYAQIQNYYINWYKVFDERKPTPEIVKALIQVTASIAGSLVLIGASEFALNRGTSSKGLDKALDRMYNAIFKK